jgi:methionyl-tRNA formyltransferase
MKILIITEEDEFYLPLCLERFLKHNEHTVLGVVLARNPLVEGKLRAAKKFFKIFGPGPVFKHACRLIWAKLFDTFPFLNRAGRYFSMQRVCLAYKLPFWYVDKINAPDFLEKWRVQAPDIILSISPTQIFKENLIQLPRYGCINIHTAKLPKYRGLYPTYWAMTAGEKTIGVSVHYIEKGIDTGRIIVQDEIDIPPRTTMDFMLKQTKLKAADLLLEAVRRIDTGAVSAFYPQGEGSYFSFPTPESYKQFRKNGYKLW